MTERTGRPVLKAVTGVWAAVSLIQLTVWLLVCVIGWHFVNPWWLWTVLVGGAVVGALWFATRSPKSVR